MNFEKAQVFLSKYCGVHVSHDTVNNHTVEVGQALREKQEEAVRRAWEEHQLPTCEAAVPPRRLYVSADGINYLQPDGRGKEIKVAAVYETEERRTKEGKTEVRALGIEYVVTTGAADLARAAYLVAVERGADFAEQIPVLGDGASWIWNRVAAMFPPRKTTEIVDFYHVTEYIWGAGKSVLGEETDEVKEWGAKYCHTLKHEGPVPVLRELRALSLQRRTTPKRVFKSYVYLRTVQLTGPQPGYVPDSAA